MNQQQYNNQMNYDDQYMDHQQQQYPPNSMAIHVNEPITQYTFKILADSLGQQTITLSQQSSTKTLYDRVRDHFRTQDFYLRTVAQKARLPENAHPLSMYLPAPDSTVIELSFITSSLDDVVTLQYMCEKCGHVFYRAVADDIVCPLGDCKHGILLKCRRPNVETTYDTI